MSKVDDVVVEIRNMILNHKYDEYGYLPSEGVLSETLEASRATVREAVRTLEVRGFLERQHGKGLCVIDNGINVLVQAMNDIYDKESIGIDDIIETRHVIEIQAVRLATERATEEDLEKLRGFVETMENAKVVDEKYLEADFWFHQNVVYIAKNAMLSAIVTSYAKWLRKTIEATTNGDINLENTHHYHRNVYEAMKARDPALAQKHMSNHLYATSENKKVLS
ncbi:MAG: FadR/GntR family transcriptional regulator [Bacillota bacterium]